MVEDEFLATAQTFTKHLHHAEYKRLKKLVRDHDASVLPNINRPTDGTTRMRVELQRKKQAADTELTTRKGVESILTGAKAKGDPTEEDASSDSDFEINHDDTGPWQGTHLQRFMVNSPRKELKSLVGLQSVNSHTRAAAGLERPNRINRRAAGQKAQTSPIAVEDAALQGVAEEDDEDTDDSDAPVHTVSRASSRPPLQVAKENQPTTHSRGRKDPFPSQWKPKATESSSHPSKRPSHRSFLDMSPINISTTPPSTRPTTKSTNPSTIDQAQRLPPSIPPGTKDSKSIKIPTQASNTAASLSTSAAIRAKLQARREKDARERARSRERRRGLDADEIPVFLV